MSLYRRASHHRQSHAAAAAEEMLEVVDVYVLVRAPIQKDAKQRVYALATALSTAQRTAMAVWYAT